MKKTFKELNEIDDIMGQIYAKNPELKNTKFAYAYKRFTDKNFVPLLTEFQKMQNYIRIDNALEDPQTKQILEDLSNPRKYKYSKEGLKKCIEQEIDLLSEFNVKEVEIETFISSYIPTLTEYEKEILQGTIIQ